MSAFQRWMDDFDPEVPEFVFDFKPRRASLAVCYSILTREESRAIERAATCANNGAMRAAEKERALAGYDGLTPMYWPHDADPED